MNVLEKGELRQGNVQTPGKNKKDGQRDDNNHQEKNENVAISEVKVQGSGHQGT